MEVRMRQTLFGATLALVSLSAQAIPFQGTYEVTVNSAGSGLQVQTQPSAGTLAFDLDDGEYTSWTHLFSISTEESTVNDDDRIPVAASIDFSFLLPTPFGGTSAGDTEGISLYFGALQAGVLTWDNGGHSSLYFGDNEILDVYLEDAVFGFGLFGLSNLSASVNGRFKYTKAGAVSVPEPATLSLLGGSMLLLGIARRKRTPRQQPVRD
jgi:hypothetical protein